MGPRLFTGLSARIWAVSLAQVLLPLCSRCAPVVLPFCSLAAGPTGPSRWHPLCSRVLVVVPVLPAVVFAGVGHSAGV